MCTALMYTNSVGAEIVNEFPRIGSHGLSEETVGWVSHLYVMQER